MTNNLKTYNPDARKAITFYSMGIFDTFNDRDGHKGLVNDYKNDANHLHENAQTMTDMTNFSVTCSNTIYEELKVSDLVSVLTEEIDSVTGVFKSLVKDIPEASVERIKTALKTCESLYDIIYTPNELSPEELEAVPAVEIELEFEFTQQETADEPIQAMVTVNMAAVSTGSFDHLADDDLDTDNKMVIMNAPVEWFYSTLNQDFKPFEI